MFITQLYFLIAMPIYIHRIKLVRLLSQYATKKWWSADCCGFICLSRSHDSQLTFNGSLHAQLLYTKLAQFQSVYLRWYSQRPSFCKSCWTQFYIITESLGDSVCVTDKQTNTQTDDGQACVFYIRSNYARHSQSVKFWPAPKVW